MHRWLIVLICFAGCDSGELRMGNSTASYRTGLADWGHESSRLTKARAAHSLVALEGEQFLALGGDSAVGNALPNRVVDKLELNLEVERCSLQRAPDGDGQCAVVATLARGVERAQALRLGEDAVVVSDGQSLQVLQLSSGQVDELDVAARIIVATDTGIAVLGIEGEKLPGNLPGPRRYGVMRSNADAVGVVEFVDPVPDSVSLHSAAALDDGHVLVASEFGSAILSVEAGTWSMAPAVPAATSDAVAVRVGDGAVLVFVRGDPMAYLYSSVTAEWRPVAVPSTSLYPGQIMSTSAGAAFLFADGAGNFQTVSFRLADTTWIAGPGGPPWATLSAMTVLDDGLVVSAGGADYDFISARAAY